jgi:hypothetical protein
MNGNRLARAALVALEVFLAVGAAGGAIWVVPTLPPEWLAGTPFRDYTVPALALGAVIGGGAVVAAGLLLVREQWGVPLSFAVGLAVAIFEVVETSVVGLDVWMYAAGLRSAVGKGLPGVDLEGVPVWLGVPVPLWQQPLYFALGIVIMGLALRLWVRSVPAHEHSDPPRTRALARA